MSFAPCVSGSTFHILQLGQAVPDGAAAAGAAPPAGHARPSSAGAKRKLSVAVSPKPTTSNTSAERASPGSAGKGGSKGGPSLGDLIDAGLLQPGDDNLAVTYKGSTYNGTLCANGTISFKGSVFNTPSAFSVHVKRLVTPGKQGDDGWHSVYADGVLLNTVRQQYHNARAASGQADSGAASAQANKSARRQQQASPRKQQQAAAQAAQQQQQQAQPQQAGAQQQQQQQQQQAPGTRPPLPKLKLGSIKGAGGQPTKLKLKQPLKLALGKANAAAAAPGVQQQQQQQPVAAGAGDGADAAAAAGNAADQPQQQADEEEPQAQHGPASPTLSPHCAGGPPAHGPDKPFWVRCCRCEAWRCVPDAAWPAVQAVGASWFCEDAGWDVRQTEPFTAACMADVWPDASAGDDGVDALLMAPHPGL